VQFFSNHKGLKGVGAVPVIAVAGAAMVVGMIMKNMTDDFFYREAGYIFWLFSGAIVGVVRHSVQPSASS